MTILTDFLLARIAEDERDARGLISEWDESPPSVYDVAQVGYIDAGSPDRVLGECEAKRRIVEAAITAASRIREGYADYAIAHEWSVKVLATVYADHPDYNPEWRI